MRRLAELMKTFERAEARAVSHSQANVRNIQSLNEARKAGHFDS
jgi:hypothetical protein